MPVKNKDERGFCGLQCGKCINGKGRTKENAKQILEDISDSALDTWQEHVPKKEPFNYEDLKKGLKWLTTLDCKGCHAGGGDPSCEFRKCGKKKGLSSCGECPKIHTPCDIVKKAKEQGVDIEKNFV